MSDSEESNPPTIHLDQFLKICGVATGGQAKLLIQGGEVKLNGAVETRRRKQLVAGDSVEFDGEEFVVELQDDTDDDFLESDSATDDTGEKASAELPSDDAGN